MAPAGDDLLLNLTPVSAKPPSEPADKLTGRQRYVAKFKERREQYLQRLKQNGGLHGDTRRFTEDMLTSANSEPLGVSGPRTDVVSKQAGDDEKENFKAKPPKRKASSKDNEEDVALALQLCKARRTNTVPGTNIKSLDNVPPTVPKEETKTEKGSKEGKDVKPKTKKMEVQEGDLELNATGPSVQEKPAAKPQIVSSLFTSNPTIPTVEEKEIANADDLKVSNSVSSEGITFVELGLDPDIAEHLIEKMFINMPTAIQRKALAQSNEQYASANEAQAIKDIILQAETGSGKTLAYILPFFNQLWRVHDSLQQAGLGVQGNRSLGTFAIILTPTRELARQVTTVLERLLALKSRASNHKQAFSTNVNASDTSAASYDNDADNATVTRRPHWIVTGLLSGGDKRKAEKARIRKGLTIVVSTPGRLLDHLKTTSSFQVGNLRWLILDEVDRLMDMGFEDDVREIVQILDERSKAAWQAKGLSTSVPVVRSSLLPNVRQTILCSATVDQNVRKLSRFITKNELVVVKADLTEAKENVDKSTIGSAIPSQLVQRYISAPSKLRLVTLTALLRKSAVTKTDPGKLVVFFACCASVDFHFELFSQAEYIQGGAAPNAAEPDEGDDIETTMQDDDKLQPATSPIIGGDSDFKIYKIHGSLPTAARLRMFNEFYKAKNGILLTTDVAARGLDFPRVHTIVQYDPPSDVGEYVHRVGRTARIGNTGEACIFLLPSENEYLDVLKANGSEPEALFYNRLLKLGLVSIARKDGGISMDECATRVQNSFELYVVKNKKARGAMRIACCFAD